MTPAAATKSVTIATKQSPGIRLRTASRDDADRLRRWKNAHRQSFFFNDEISPEMQARWMETYLRRADDYMFIVESEGQPVGCLALRVEHGLGDVYNVILGEVSAGGQGVMSTAIAMMLAFGRTLTSRIGLKVLSVNETAIRFYERNGFVRTGAGDDYFELTVDWTRVRPVEVHIT